MLAVAQVNWQRTTRTTFTETGQREYYRFCGEALKLSTLHNAHYRRFTRGALHAAGASHDDVGRRCPVSLNLRQSHRNWGIHSIVSPKLRHLACRLAQVEALIASSLGNQADDDHSRCQWMLG